MYKIVLLRHGESTWNKENRFTGWTDVDLSEKGMEEARSAGRVMREAGYEFDVAYVSVLKRALRTLWLALEEMERIHIERILRANGYSRTRTAEALAISKKTLYLKIKRYGLKTAD